MSTLNDGLIFDIHDNIVYIMGHADLDVESIIIPSEINGYPVKIIDERAFASYRKLKNIILPNTIIEIRSAAFYDCEDLIDINIPDSVNTIGHAIFYNCTNLTDIKIPSNFCLEEIGDFIFWNCVNLKNVKLGKNIKRIGKHAFTGCLNLINIELPQMLEYIDTGLFCGCKKLKNVKLPNHVKEIKSNAFTGCINLTELIIPNSVRSIDTKAFTYCQNFKRIAIGASVTDISFLGCIKNNLESIDVDKNNRNYVSDNGVLFKGDEEDPFDIMILTIYPLAKKDKKYNIPSWVDCVKENAFDGAKYLEDIYFINDFKWIK